MKNYFVSFSCSGSVGNAFCKSETLTKEVIQNWTMQITKTAGFVDPVIITFIIEVDE